MSSAEETKVEAKEEEKKQVVLDRPTISTYDGPTMTTALFIYWILPVAIIAIFSRYTVDTSVGEIDVRSSGQSIPFMLDQSYIDETDAIVGKAKPEKQPEKKSPQKKEESWQAPDSWPTEYTNTIRTIEKRRPRWNDHPKYLLDGANQDSSAASSQKDTSPQPDTTSRPKVSSRDPQKQQLIQVIDNLRNVYETDKSDLLAAVKLADAMRYYDVTYHEGGTYENEAIQTYLLAAEMAETDRQERIARGEPTNIAKKDGITNLNQEVTIDYSLKSVDGILCGIYTGLGKVYFMANMFEKAVDAYTKCLAIEPMYTDALNSRASSFIVLGKYQEAGADFMHVIKYDLHRLFPDAFTGLARVLEADETAVPDGWETLSLLLEKIIPMFEEKLLNHPERKQMLAPGLSRFHHALFTYHDKKTKDTDAAFTNLSKSYEYKMSLLPPWAKGSELQKSAVTKQIFTRGFWSGDTGSDTVTPIFIVGFVRSGSTLLERVLDAHPLIVGTGENSVFNGRLPDIRDKIVAISNSGMVHELPSATKDLADSVVDGMKRRWEKLEAATPTREDSDAEPERFVDKMLTNYNNIGFIHLLYPNALILHVYRNPMDTVFSAYKHDFPAGPLDYSCDFEGLAEMYHSYRDVIEHWDEVLPGRVVHVRHEDMVNDFEGMARAIIEKTGLPWDDSVLEFHKKKHAVNTFSSTQVRKGVYKGGMGAWKKYERYLEPLSALLGDRVSFDIPHSLQPTNLDTKDEL